MIIQIRGTSGSGKTHTAYDVMARLGIVATDLGSNDKDVVAYRLGVGAEKQVALIGKYATACGGCDAIKTQDEIGARVRRYHNLGYHVLFEGLLASQIYQRYSDLADEFAGAYTFAYLDTPLDVCLKQVEARREAAFQVKVAKAVGRKHDVLPEQKPLNPSNTIQKWHDCQRNRTRDLAAGHRVIDLKHDGEPARQVLEWLNLRHIDHRPTAKVLPFPVKETI